MKNIIVIPCSKSKADGTMPAKVLYTGTLFKKTYEYAQLRKPDEIIIIGGEEKIDIINPETIISTYDGLDLNNVSCTNRRKLAVTRLDNLIAHGCNPSEDHFTFLTGKLYYEFIIDNQANALPGSINHKNVELTLSDCKGIGYMLQRIDTLINNLKK